MGGANLDADLTERGKFSIRWPIQVLGPAPGLKEINLICWSMFFLFLVAPVSVISWLQVRAGAGSIRQLHSDFVYFYGDGEIAKEHSAASVYDYSLQLKTFNQIFPARDGSYGPSPYPPFVALFFSLLARMPFETAYLLWAVISLTLYSAGIAAISNEVFPGLRLERSLILCFALAFCPFFFETLINGQLASVAICSLGFGISQERRSRPFAGGMALSILAYKPTLLLLLVPMLLLTRRIRTLLGFITGAVVLILVTTALAGIQIWPAYVRFLVNFGHVTGLNGRTALKLWQFVDLNSLSCSVPGGRSKVGLLLLIGIAVAIATWLAVVLWKSARRGLSAQSLAWAVTLTWTLLLNVYVPIYDSVLVALAIVLTLGALRDARWRAEREWVLLLSVLIFAVSWITEAFARRHGIQLLTLFLAVLGLAQILLLQRFIDRDASHRQVEPAAQ